MKPENVLLNEKGQAKMCDMGIAKVVVGRTCGRLGRVSALRPLLADGIHAHTQLSASLVAGLKIMRTDS